MILSDNELKLYKILLEHGIVSAYKASKLASIPPSKIYSIANKLKEKGFLFIIQGKPELYRPVNIDDAINNYEKEHLDSIKKELKDLKQQLSYLKTNESNFEIIWGLDCYINYIKPILKHTKEYDMLTSFHGIANFLKTDLFKFINKNKIKFRLIIPENARELTKNLKSQFVNIRYRNIVPTLAFHILGKGGGSFIFFQDKHYEDSKTTYCLHTKSNWFYYELFELFEYFWNISKT